MSSKYFEYLNLYVWLQIWKIIVLDSKYFEKYLTPILWQMLIALKFTYIGLISAFTNCMDTFANCYGIYNLSNKSPFVQVIGQVPLFFFAL